MGVYCTFHLVDEEEFKNVEYSNEELSDFLDDNLKLVEEGDAYYNPNTFCTSKYWIPSIFIINNQILKNSNLEIAHGKFHSLKDVCSITKKIEEVNLNMLKEIVFSSHFKIEHPYHQFDANLDWLWIPGDFETVKEAYSLARESKKSIYIEVE